MTNPIAPYEVISTDELPEVVRRYLQARSVGDVEVALDACCEDVILVDVEDVHRGRERLRAVLERPIAERKLTFATTGAAKLGDDRFDIAERIEGDLVDGGCDLRYRFVLHGGLIEMITIEYGGDQ